MAVLKMQRISICALKKDRKAILEKLQSLGVVEINHVIEEDEDLRRWTLQGKRQVSRKRRLWQNRRSIFLINMFLRRSRCLHL